MDRRDRAVMSERPPYRIPPYGGLQSSVTVSETPPNAVLIHLRDAKLPRLEGRHGKRIDWRSAGMTLTGFIASVLAAAPVSSQTPTATAPLSKPGRHNDPADIAQVETVVREVWTIVSSPRTPKACWP